MGKSSKPSSSKPSPKWRRLTGFVICLLDAASFARASAPRARDLDGLGERIFDLETALEEGRNSLLAFED